MDARARRQALRQQLSQARAAWDAGDPAAALRTLDDALALDPHFLAAQALREHIAGGVTRSPAPPGPQPSAQRPSLAAGRAPFDVSRTSPAPLVSADGWVRFEHRARLRRIDKRADAARAAMARGHLTEVEAAIEEIRTLDATHPDIISLGMELDAVGQFASRRPSRAGPAMAAAVVFAMMVLGARRVDRQPAAAVNLPAPGAMDPAPTPAPKTELPAIPRQDARTAPDDVSPAHAEFPPPEPTEPSRESVLPQPEHVIRAAMEPTVSPGVSPGTIVSGTIDPDPPPPAPAAPVAAVLPDVALVSAEPTAHVPGDEELVRRVLQHYRMAYEALDVRSARTVWPGVDEAALQRAFDGLQSQQLTFTDCDVHLRGASGIAVCRGAARYVPKVGSSDGRAEPRVWNFSLRKAGEDWQIESARAER